MRTDDENTDFFLMFTNPVCIAAPVAGEWKELQDRNWFKEERNVNITRCGKHFFVWVASLGSCKL